MTACAVATGTGWMGIGCAAARVTGCAAATHMGETGAVDDNEAILSNVILPRAASVV